MALLGRRLFSKLVRSELNFSFESACALSSRQASTAENAGKVFGACLLERHPVIEPLAPEWEIEYHTWAEQFRSLRYKQTPDDFAGIPKQKDDDLQQDEESARIANWRPHPRVTEADKTGDEKSLMRSLDQYLCLVVKRNGKWDFPTVERESGETIRQTGERALQSVVGKSIQSYFWGNCPAGHIETGAKGDRVFFLRAQIIQGNLEMGEESGYSDYAWINREELPKYLKDEKLEQMVSVMMMKYMDPHWYMQV